MIKHNLFFVTFLLTHPGVKLTHNYITPVSYIILAVKVLKQALKYKYFF